MSIKILLISSDDDFINTVENIYKKHVESGFFTIYSPEMVEKSPSKIHYELIITEEEYVNLITVKTIPVIVILKKTESQENIEKKDNFTYITEPINWENLYDIILSLQYKSNFLVNTYSKAPKVSDIKSHGEIKQQNNRELNSFHIDLMEDNINLNNLNVNENNIKIDKNINQLVTTIYEISEMKNINKIINDYSSNNNIDEKIIAQACIIIDELVHTIKSVYGFNDTQIMNKEPKIIININNNDSEFNIKIQCLIKNIDINNVLFTAQDYANTVHSFKRNNDSFIDIHWYLY